MGTSTTTPPSGTTADPVPSLYLSDTFYTWFNTTNDVINKVNPIEVYTLAAATGGYNSNSIAAAYGSTTGIGGVTIDDLGNGNFKLGYVIPEKITGGHTFYGHIDFKKGPSGHIANSFCGRTGEIVGVNTVSGRLPVVSGGTGNITGCVIQINGILATEGGTIAITAGDIEGSLASSTGPAGFIITATGGFEMDAQTKLFDGIPDSLQGTDTQYQNALLVHGASGASTGTRPAVAIGGQSCDASYGLLVDGGAWYGGHPQGGSDKHSGGIKLKGNNKDNYFDISAVDSLHIGACADIIMNIDHVADGSAEFKVTKSSTANGTPGQISNLMRVNSSGELFVDKIRGVDDSATMITLSDGDDVKINKILHIADFVKDNGGDSSNSYRQNSVSGTDASGFVLRPNTAGKMDWQNDYVIDDSEAPSSADGYSDGAVWYQTGGGAAGGAGTAVGNKTHHVSITNNTKVSLENMTSLDLFQPVRSGITSFDKWQGDVNIGSGRTSKAERGWDVYEVGTDSNGIFTVKRLTARPYINGGADDLSGTGLLPIGLDMAGTHASIKISGQFGVAQPLSNHSHDEISSIGSNWAIHAYVTQSPAPMYYSGDGWSHTDPVIYDFCESQSEIGTGVNWSYTLKSEVHQSRLDFRERDNNQLGRQLIRDGSVELGIPIGSSTNNRLFICVSDERPLAAGSTTWAPSTDKFQLDEVMIDAYSFDA